MCGIAGFVLQQGEASLPAVRAMCDQIVHRGPDDEGYYVGGPCALGMRRLSIIDLSTGHQPIANEDASVQVVFNGEIYNYRELRRDLLQKGHFFSTASDTEVLVHLYEEHGVSGLSRLRGMFAFAIWDARRRRLFLARDRFGKKPLYYAALPQGLYFGSELKCLRVAGIPLDLHEDALRLYFQFGYIPDPYSPFRAVRKLMPGGWLLYAPDGALTEGRYWRPALPAVAPPRDLSEDQARARLREVFDEAVRIRMVADVPLGAFLSGGIDSSAVVASMALQSSEPVKTFSIGFAEAAYNELPYAALVARKYCTDHHEIVVEPDAVELISRLVRHFDEPFGDSSAIPTFIVSEFAARHVKVALSGDGGDELLAGYERFFPLLEPRLADRLPGLLRRPLGWLAAGLPYAAYGKNYLYMLSRPSAFERYVESNFLNYHSRKELLRPKWMFPERAFLERRLADSLPPGDGDVLSRGLYFETAVNLPSDMLVKVDRMSMASSLEVRCPLLDSELAALAFSLPHRWKIRNGQGKRIFIDAMADRLPPELLRRPKQGFAVPLNEWFRGTLRDFLRDHLDSPRFLDRGIVSPAFLKYLLDEHERGRRDNERWLWPLLMLELWFRLLEAPASAVPESAAAGCARQSSDFE